MLLAVLLFVMLLSQPISAQRMTIHSDGYLRTEYDISRVDSICFAEASDSDSLSPRKTSQKICRRREMADGDVIELEKNSLANFKRYAFSIVGIRTFGSIRMHHGDAVEEYQSGYVEIDSTNITIYRYYSDSRNYTVTYPHGLTIGNSLQFSLTVGASASNAIIELVSDGNMFRKEDINWSPCHGMVKLVSIGSNLCDVDFSYGSTNVGASTLLMGDSYMGHADKARWCYYLVHNGFDNYILNAYPGETAVSGLADLKVLLTHFTPKRLFWCYGMNNIDSSSTVNSSWMSAYEEVAQICRESDIELILMTFPTARGGKVDDTNISNMRVMKHKNAIIRESGFRYVDIDKAFGADEETGEWYDGYMSSDGVHPTEKGAVVMYNAIMTTIPEMAER